MVLHLVVGAKCIDSRADAAYYINAIVQWILLILLKSSAYSGKKWLTITYIWENYEHICMQGSQLNAPY